MVRWFRCLDVFGGLGASVVRCLGGCAVSVCLDGLGVFYVVSCFRWFMSGYRWLYVARWFRWLGVVLKRGGARDNA